VTGPTPSGPPVRRRALLGGLLAVAGCAGPLGPVDTVPGRAVPADPLPAPEPTPEPAPVERVRPALLDDPAAYRVLPGEVEPACKEAAVAFVTAALTLATAGTRGVPADERIRALGQPLAPAGSLAPLLPAGGASALEVVYPQYGGLTERRDTASVMLVADQLLVPGPDEREVRRRSLTLDVRLHRAGDRWLVDEVLPAAEPPAAARPSPAAQALLADDRVVLPAAARADLLAGLVHDAVAGTLSELARRWRLHVQVLAAGHPPQVWGTDRPSNHGRGRAVDLWAVDGVPVVDRATCAWRELMRAGSAAGATEVGGPEALGVRGHFTDHTHQDHVHLGFGRV
jgi:hypothetical protein